MALDDALVLVPGKGAVFTATSGTDPWTTTQIDTFISSGEVTIPVGWAHLGHTDVDSPLTPAQDGGDTTTLGSWQNDALKQTQAPVTDSFTVPAEQVLDTDIMKLYYGGGTDTTPGEFSAPDSPAPQERAWMVLFIDGTTVLGWGGAKASILRGDAASISTDDFMKLPLTFTILKASGKPRFKFISSALSNESSSSS